MKNKMLRLLDVSFARPEENLALDEALLEAVEWGHSSETLRFWESPRPFVVIGVGQVLRNEANEPGCAAAGVSILRRCSAGGAVVQGPGCLNYVLALRFENYPEIRTIRGSYCFILGRMVHALRSLGVNASIEGISDLAVDGFKFSGNAQKRRKHAILHHGTLLYNMSADWMTRYLREPAQRPEYRGGRSHGDFVKSLRLDEKTLRVATLTAFGVETSPVEVSAWEEERMRALVAEKYGQRAWNYRR